MSDNTGVASHEAGLGGAEAPEPDKPSRPDGAIPNADRLRAILCRWRRREEGDDGACWHSVPAIGRALINKAKLTRAEKEMTRGLLVRLVASGEAEVLETTDQGASFRAGGAEFAPKPVRIPGPKLFVLQREFRGPGSTCGWFDAEAFETWEQALAGLKYGRWVEQARIDGWGGSGYTMERPRRMRVVRLTNEASASGMSASGQDPQGLEAKPASPTGEAGDAPTGAHP